MKTNNLIKGMACVLLALMLAAAALPVAAATGTNPTRLSPTSYTFVLGEPNITDPATPITVVYSDAPGNVELVRRSRRELSERNGMWLYLTVAYYVEEYIPIPPTITVNMPPTHPAIYGTTLVVVDVVHSRYCHTRPSGRRVYVDYTTHVNFHVAECVDMFAFPYHVLTFEQALCVLVRSPRFNFANSSGRAYNFRRNGHYLVSGDARREPLTVEPLVIPMLRMERPAFFTQEQLLAWEVFAPTVAMTRSEIDLCIVYAATQDELDAWADEYWALGGPNSYELQQCAI